MCGVCGFAGPGDRATLETMMARMAYRGPDGSGVHEHPQDGLRLGHLRLAIVDLAGGAQPMLTADDALAVTFNGEIYNHQELRRELEGLGHRFQTSHCDTEVLLHGYRQWGADLPARLNGMWAFAIHDTARRQVFLSRDRFGKKPLYYTLRPGFFAFASELAALLAHPEVPRQVSPMALKKYFAYGFVPAPSSLYAGVNKLPGGHNLLVDLTNFTARETRYWAFHVDPHPVIPKNPVEAWGEEIRDTLTRAVKRRLMSDVPLGVFLSGGVDSSAVTAVAAKLSPGLRTFSIGFEEASFDESRYSLRVAKLLGTNHQQDTLNLDEALAIAPKIMAELDEPMGDSSILPTWLLSRQTRRHVTVALGGDGADELFAGYATFQALGLAKVLGTLCPRPVHRALRAVAARMPVSHGYMTLGFKVGRLLMGLDSPMRLWNPAWLSCVEPARLGELFGEPCDPEEVYSEAIDAWEACPSPDLTDKTLEFYTRFYLQDGVLTKVDRASMLNSLEVRAPFLDLEMADLARRIPHRYKFRGGQGKWVLKKALEPWLPKDVLYRSKQGFGAPVGQWLAQGRFPLPPEAELAPWLSRDFMAKRLAEHVEGKADNRLFLWNLWVLGEHLSHIENPEAA